MGYYLGLYLNYWRLFLKTQAQYRVNMAISIGGLALQEGATLLFLVVIFANIRRLQGWSYPEVLMTYGLLSLTRGLWNLTLDVPHRLGWYIRTGSLDYLLVRPAGVLFQIMGVGGLNPTSAGRVVISIIAIAAAVRAQGGTAWWWALYLPAAVVSGVLLTFSLYLILACLSFSFVEVTSLMVSLHLVSQFGQFPAPIFGPALQFVLTWVLPFAMTSFYPMAFLLRGDAYRLYGLLSLVVGWGFLALALAAWRLGIRHYQSTGS